MGATIEDVHEGNRENVRLLGAGQVGDVGVQRDTLLSSGSLGDGHGDTEDGVGSELGLVGSAIKLVKEAVNGGLVLEGRCQLLQPLSLGSRSTHLDIEVLLDEGRSNDRVDMVDSLGHTLATPLGLVSITVALVSLAVLLSSRYDGKSQMSLPELAGLVGAGGGTRGDNGAVKTGLGDNVDLKVLVVALRRKNGTDQTNLDSGVTARVVDGACVNLYAPRGVSYDFLAQVGAQ